MYIERVHHRLPRHALLVRGMPNAPGRASDHLALRCLQAALSAANSAASAALLRFVVHECGLMGLLASLKRFFIMDQARRTKHS